MHTPSHLDTVEQSVARFTAGIKGEIGRALTSTEVELLQAAGNESENWSHIRVCWSHVDGTPNCARIRNCTFLGRVLIGNFNSKYHKVTERGLSLPIGLRNSVIANCVLGDDALVLDCTTVSNTFVGANASLIGCGTVTSNGASSMANGMKLEVVVEVGGREVPCFAEMSLDDAVSVIERRLNAAGAVENADNYALTATSPCTIVQNNAQLLNCRLVLNTFIGPFARVEDATVEGSTIMSNEAEQTRISDGSTVRDSIVQWKTSIDSQSIVERAVLLSCSYVQRHGKVFESVLGYYSGVAEGEVTSSLVGPFVGFHHQALLIACYWPAGKGNVGYGANVGSNHTGKAPDQELWAGEGVFFGLGCCIKFPANYVEAIYSIVATGVVTLPQKIEFPFSLISSAQSANSTLSAAINEIQPSWVLSDNIYTILRNQTKFLKRGNQSDRFRVQSDILTRPDVAILMLKARGKLLSPKPADIYTDKDIVGLGKNFMTEQSRVKAIQTYTFFIEYYALCGVWQLVASAPEHLSGNTLDAYLQKHMQDQPEVTFEQLVSKFPCNQTGVYSGHSVNNAVNRAEHQLAVAHSELGLFTSRKPSCKKFLLKLAEAQEAIADSVLKSKMKDNKRGNRIIADYEVAHGNPAEVDAVVVAARAEAVRLRHNISEFIRIRYPSPRI